ncbi:hypothetical protein GMRT_13234 [Giardia muris]|uniref:Cilia- and flagella-associated protein 206 n=1 Tax=Giardia muris TaxID=5742 RepID=A0A4Z1SYY9_GIAMU|nr:hypothetical protein GMRT_13234 [Giardia muris]|eukprot:TNJ28708.1 hypothetical protein GMRT_13234 [Giardia muris]
MNSEASTSLATQLVQKSRDAGIELSDFMATFIVEYLLLSLRLTSLARTDFDRVLDLSLSLLLGFKGPNTAPSDILSHTLQLLSAHSSELAGYHEQSIRARDRLNTRYQEVYSRVCTLDTPEQIMGAFEDLLKDVHMPLSLGQGHVDAQVLTAALKLSLSSVLSPSDVLVFKDILVNESTQPDQLVELIEVASGVTVVGDPPTAQLQALEHSIATLVRAVETQYTQICGVFTGSVLPLLLYNNETGISGDRIALAKARETMMYAINRLAIVKAFASFLREARGLAELVGTTAESLRSEVTTLHKLLAEKESVPKVYVYPKFTAVARQNRTLALACQSFAHLKQWHTKLMSFIDDYAFTILPEASAKTPLYTMEDLDQARQWVQKTYQSFDLATTTPTKEPGSRVLRFGVNISTKAKPGSAHPPYIKSLGSFSPLDSEALFGTTYLFGGFDPFFLMNPVTSWPGVPIPVVIPGFSTSLTKAGEIQPIGSACLSISADQTELVQMLHISPSDLASQILCMAEDDGYGLVAFSSILTRSAFATNPPLLMASILALSLSSPEFLPLVILLDLCRVSHVLGGDAFNRSREALVTEYGEFHVAILPASHLNSSHEELSQGNLQSLLIAPSEALQPQVDPCGFIRGVPSFISLFTKVVVSRQLAFAGALAEDAETSIFGAQYVLKELLDTSFLKQYESLCANGPLARWREVERTYSMIGPDDLIPLGADGTPKPNFDKINKAPSKGTSLTGGLPQEIAIQTPLHFYERNIVPGYTSSEWELRARALRIYQIQQKRTHTTQTSATTFKTVKATETVESTDAATQSKVDAATHATSHFRFIHRPLPASLSDSIADRALMNAGVVKRTSETTMSLNLDDVAKKAEEFRRLREKAKATMGQSGSKHD